MPMFCLFGQFQLKHVDHHKYRLVLTHAQLKWDADVNNVCK